MLTLDKIYHARYVLKQVIRETDLIHAPKINPESEIFLKTENLQITGSFKVRGAYYKISQLSDEEKLKALSLVRQVTTLRVLHLPLQKMVSNLLSACQTVLRYQRLRQQKITVQRFVSLTAFTTMLTLRLSGFVMKKDIHLFTRLMTKTLLQVRVLSDLNLLNSFLIWTQLLCR